MWGAVLDIIALFCVAALFILAAWADNYNLVGRWVKLLLWLTALIGLILGCTYILFLALVPAP